MVGEVAVRLELELNGVADLGCGAARIGLLRPVLMGEFPNTKCSDAPGNHRQPASNWGPAARLSRPAAARLLYK